MLYCWKCSDPNPDHYRFCGQCGAPAQRPNDDAAPGDAAQSSSTQSPEAATVSAAEAIRRMMDEAMPKPAAFGTGMSSTRTVSFMRVGGSGTSNQIIFNDSAGNRCEFKSLDEVPPELLKDLRAAMDAVNAAPAAGSAGQLMDALTARFRRPYPFARPTTDTQSPVTASTASLGVAERMSGDPDSPLPVGGYRVVGPVALRFKGKKRPEWMQWLIALLSLYGLYALFF